MEVQGPKKQPHTESSKLPEPSNRVDEKVRRAFAFMRDALSGPDKTGAAKHAEHKTKEKLFDFRSLDDLEKAIKSATTDVVFYEKQATRDNATQKEERAKTAAEARGRLSQLKTIKAQYETQLQKNVVLDDGSPISAESLLKIVTAAVNQGIITSTTSELPGSFGMVAATTITEGGREFRVMMEMDTKGDLRVRKIGDKIAEGAEGVVSHSPQLDKTKPLEVIKEPKEGNADEGDEEISKPDIRREAKLMARAKEGMEKGITVRHVMGRGDVGFMLHKSGGDMTKIAAAKRAAVVLLQIPPDQVNSRSAGTKWEIQAKRKNELAQELANMAMNQAKTPRGRQGQRLLDDFVSNIGEPLLSKKTFNDLQEKLNPEAIFKLTQEKGTDDAKKDLEALFAEAIDKVIAELPSAYETFDAQELFTTITTEIESGHKNGIIHRDIKPGNILHALDKEARVGSKSTLADYGMAVDLREVRENFGVPNGFTLGRQQDRREVQDIVTVLKPFEKGKEVNITDGPIVQRLVHAGMLQKSKDQPPKFTIADKKGLEMLDKHLAIANSNKVATFLPPGTNLYNFNPYFELAGEYLKRGDLDSYERILKKLDEIAGAMTFYELTTGERMPPDIISMGLICVRLSDQDLAEAERKLREAGQPPEVVKKIMQMMTPNPRVNFDPLKDAVLPRYPTGFSKSS